MLDVTVLRRKPPLTIGGVVSAYAEDLDRLEVAADKIYVRKAQELRLDLHEPMGVICAQRWCRQHWAKRMPPRAAAEALGKKMPLLQGVVWGDPWGERLGGINVTLLRDLVLVLTTIEES